MYRAVDGLQDRRNWRQGLLEVLDGWLRLFPDVACKRNGRLSLGFAPDAQPSAVSADDLGAEC